MALLLTLTALLGIAAGWALTVPVHRYKEMRPMTPRDLAAEAGSADHPPTVIRAEYREARCPSCHHVYRSADVVPVLSWFRGCPECGTRLPLTVPLVQAGVPIAMVLTVSVLNGTWVALPYLWLVVVLAAVAVIDLRIWLIPWWMPWVGTAVGFVMICAVSLALGIPQSILHAVIGGVGSFLLFFVLWLVAPGKLGFGDVRLVLLLGMFLGWLHPLFPVYGLLFGSLIGLVMGLGSILARRGAGFPFGPALALGALLAVWLNQPILHSMGVA
jgi:leader peptidase (prepilin peptidase) / N-methyltransferase